MRGDVIDGYSVERSFAITARLEAQGMETARVRHAMGSDASCAAVCCEVCFWCPSSFWGPGYYPPTHTPKPRDLFAWGGL